MAQLNYGLPVIGSSAATEDPKVRTALADIQTWANGANIGTDNIANGAVTQAKRSAAIYGFNSFNGAVSIGEHAPVVITATGAGRPILAMLWVSAPSTTSAKWTVRMDSTTTLFGSTDLLTFKDSSDAQSVAGFFAPPSAGSHTFRIYVTVSGVTANAHLHIVEL